MVGQAEYLQTLQRAVEHHTPACRDEIREVLSLYKGRPTKGLVQAMILLNVKLMSMLEISGDRRRALEARVATLEARPSLKYVGVWKADTQNNEGEFVTHEGSLWYCHRSTRERPGNGKDFTLAVKRGKDARA